MDTFGCRKVQGLVAAEWMSSGNHFGVWGCGGLEDGALGATAGWGVAKWKSDQCVVVGCGTEFLGASSTVPQAEMQAQVMAGGTICAGDQDIELANQVRAMVNNDWARFPPPCAV